MKRVSLAVFLLITAAMMHVHGQGNTGMYLMDNNGAPVNTKNYLDVIGTPFFNEEWCEGTLKLKNGQLVNNAFVKINEHTNEIHFLNSNKQEIIILRGLVQEVTLTQNGERFRFITGIEALGANKIFLVMKEGLCMVLKNTERKISEVKEFNSATVTRKFQSAETYHLLMGDRATSSVRDIDAVLSFLEDQKGPLQEFVQKEKIKIKKPGDLIRLVEYYNFL